MDITNVSGEAIALTKLGVTIANGATETDIDDKWLQDPDIAALVTAAKLTVANFESDVGSMVVQPEVAAALAASHTHTNSAELDLVSDGDHDVRTDNPHAVDATQAGADAAGSAATVQGNLDTHTGTTSGNPHGVTAAEAGADAAGSAATVQGNLDTHTGTTSGNPHGVTAAEAGADATGSAAAVQSNLDTHTGDTANPHSVTPAQVAAANDWTTPPTSTTTGEMVFDTTAGQPYWWDGSQWVDATGAAHA